VKPTGVLELLADRLEVQITHVQLPQLILQQHVNQLQELKILGVGMYLIPDVISELKMVNKSVSLTANPQQRQSRCAAIKRAAVLK
jgi:hypothetical protein